MTRTRRTASSIGRLTLLVLLAFLAAPLFAEEPGPPLEQLLREQTQALLDAVGRGDKEVWDRYLDPGALYVNEAGDVGTKEELLAELRPLPPGLVGELRIATFTVVVHGDTAIATHEDHESLDYFGQRLATRFRSTHTWRRVPEGWRLIAAQVLAIPQDPPAIQLPAAALDELAGTYQLTPEISYTIRRGDGDRLYGRRTGRDETELHAEAADVLFVKGQPRSRKVMLRDAAGRVTGFADRREGLSVVWKRTAAAPADGKPPG